MRADALLDLAAINQQLAKTDNQFETYRQCLEHARLTLDQHFLDGRDIAQILLARSQLIDLLLVKIWQQCALDKQHINLSLLAVGGYGRGQLHPFSDIDILLLLESEPEAQLQDAIAQFLTSLWDLGLEVGHSVRTLEQCSDEAKKDLTIITNLMESRQLTGSSELYQQLQSAITTQQMWSSAEFFLAKKQERRERHDKYNDTEYNLEPNVKNSPGGLRDIQNILWIARRRFGMCSLESLQAPGFLTADEFAVLNRAQSFLWRVRYALHMLAGRGDERLLLQYQHKLAQLFGYSDDDTKQAIEQFMQLYYRTVMSVAELSDFINQLFEENIGQDHQPQLIEPLNQRFQVNNGFLQHIDPQIFSRCPSAILEVFVLLAQHPHISGANSQTIRLLREHRHLIDDNFRRDPRNTSLFIQLFSCAEGIHMNLRRMNRYGILGRYLPEFGRIIGQMQHDLYHIYTVDAHTLNLIKHLRKLRHADFAEKFSLASAILGRLPKLEIIYLAGLYHDIGKGRGGDHSELGAVDAENFALRHQLPTWDRRLLVWLVRNHLIMSQTAQRKDITDPEVINDFARQVGEQVRLDYLYVLTVADLNATNPKLWNSWRAQLLRQLYGETRRALRRGLENPLERDEQIASRQATAMSFLCSEDACQAQVEKVWKNLDDDYFLRHGAGEIAWHTDALIKHTDSQQPLVLVRESSQRGFEGGTQVFVYAPSRSDLFAATAAALDQLNLSIHEARILTSGSKFTIESYVVLEADGGRIGNDPERINEISQGLQTALQQPDNYPQLIQRRVPRRLQHFAFSPHISIHNDAQRAYTVVEVTAPDRPGLLAKIAQVFVEFDLAVASAKIITQGERIEDVFFLTDHSGQQLSDPELCANLQEALSAQLSTTLN